ncbi:MAG: arylsulfatase [Bacteroidota bacterium]
MKLYYYLILLAFIGCEKADSPSEKKQKPNVLFILTDDQAWGDLSINGNTNLNTPHIDQLAKNGAIFDRFYVSPVCSPTRAEILTGRYHSRSGVYATSAGGERMDLDETTIAQVFKKAGYQTAAYGKWHNGMQYPYHPNARGFDDFYGFCSGHWGHYFSPMLEHNGKIVKGEGFVIDDFTNQAMNFMESHKDEPFFLYLPYNTPHSPMQVPDEYWDRFKNKELKMHNRDAEKENPDHIKAALAMVENIDWNVGRMVKKLQELDLEENTIIVYLSDNGPNGVRWNGNMKGRKGSTDEGGVRSPTIIQWKGHIKAGIEISQISAAIDFLPTLSELAGIEYESKKKLDGISLKPLLLGTTESWEDRYIINHWRGKTSVRTQNYRLGHEDQLFDMLNDPGQRKDIKAEKEEIYTDLFEVREAWLRSVDTEVPEKDPRPFVVGHPDFTFNQLPARDAKVTGNITRSNRYPNCSFYSNWTSKEEKIYFPMEVLAEGEFEAILYYTCSEENVGAKIRLSFGDDKLDAQITEAHDPPLYGMEEDKDPRIESYVKEFKPLTLGTIHLTKGNGELSLEALEIPGKEVLDFRLLMLNRLSP